MAEDRAIAIFIIGVLCLILAVGIAVFDFFIRRRSLKRMHAMIQSAIDGTFRADLYDESLVAAVENKLAE